VNFLNTTLFAIWTMIAVFVFAALPSILVLKGWEARQAVPREIYDRERPHVLRLRPIWLWIASAAFGQIGRICSWMHESRLENLADYLSLFFFGVVILSYLIWAIRIVCQDDLDPRLIRFGRFVLWGSSFGMLAVAAIGYCAILK
jgi:hypothetical protein